MQTREIVVKILEEAGLIEYGFVPFISVLPLLECRAKKRLPEAPETVIVCLFPYYLEGTEQRNLSRYAVVEDYHEVVPSILEPVCERLQAQYPAHRFAAFSDNSPIREVAAAARAGIGVVGKNHLLIHPKYGSYVFIGEIVTDLKIETTEPCVKNCKGCGRCLKACPGQAITSSGIDREKCLSHITQKKGVLTAEEEALVKEGGLLWGCDVCQEICPYNRELSETPISAFRESVIERVEAEQIAELVQTRAFGFRGERVVRRNFEIIYGKKR